jgi:hypothetical protein
MLAPRGEDCVDEVSRPECDAVGKVTHPSPQHLPAIQAAFRRQHSPYLLRTDPTDTFLTRANACVEVRSLSLSPSLGRWCRRG